MRGHIEHLKGIPHVVIRDTLWDEPMEILHYYPLPSAIHQVVDGDKTYESLEYPGEATVQTRMGPKRFYYPEGGKTRPTKTETNPISKPIIRVQTRWYQGRWQKYLKREGWVNA